MEELAVPEGMYGRRALRHQRSHDERSDQTTEAAVHELEHFAIGMDPRQVNAIARRVIETIQDAGHVHRLAMAGIEVACWDILGKWLGVPIYQLLGGRQRDSILSYANGWYRAERTPESSSRRRRRSLVGGSMPEARSLGLAQGFISEPDLQQAYDVLMPCGNVLDRR